MHFDMLDLFDSIVTYRFDIYEMLGAGVDIWKTGRSWGDAGVRQIARYGMWSGFGG
jgi:hypothetical protein